MDRCQANTVTKHEKFLADAIVNCHVHLLDMDKEDFYATYTGRPSMVFLDADHSYQETLADLKWAQSTGAEVICGHDYSPTHPGVVQAVEESGGYTKLVDSLWVLKKKRSSVAC